MRERRGPKDLRGLRRCRAAEERGGKPEEGGGGGQAGQWGAVGAQRGRRERRACNMVVLQQRSQLDGVSSPSTLFFSFF